MYTIRTKDINKITQLMLDCSKTSKLLDPADITVNIFNLAQSKFSTFPIVNILA